MRTLCLVAGAVVAAWMVGCGSSTPPAESPEAAAEEPVGSGEPGPAAEEPPDEAAPPPAEATAKPASDGSIPDDYEMMSGDCVQLGKQLAEVTRADQLQKLSPRLSEAQRTQTEKSITDVANRVGEKWAEGCQSSLVGKVVDRKSLKCAMDSRTVKAFDACLNTSSEGADAAQNSNNK